MPTINAFYSNSNHNTQLSAITNDFKIFAAKELSCDEITLRPDEISVRIIKADGAGMLAELELEITAHAYPERVKRQDEICLNIRKYLIDKLDTADIRVWLLLPQLGHSWEAE